MSALLARSRVAGISCKPSNDASQSAQVLFRRPYRSLLKRNWSEVRIDLHSKSDWTVIQGKPMHSSAKAASGRTRIRSADLKHILLVEDDADLSILLKDFLEAHFYRVDA